MRWRRFAGLRIATQLDAQRCASSIPRFGGFPAPACSLTRARGRPVEHGGLTFVQLVNHRERGVLKHGMTSRKELVAAKNLARKNHLEALSERLAILMENPEKFADSIAALRERIRSLQERPKTFSDSEAGKL